LCDFISKSDVIGGLLFKSLLFQLRLIFLCVGRQELKDVSELLYLPSTHVRNSHSQSRKSGIFSILSERVDAKELLPFQDFFGRQSKDFFNSLVKFLC